MRRNMRRGVVFLGIVVLFLAHLHAKVSDESRESQKIRASIDQNYRSWVQATKRKDVAAVLAIYADDAIVLPPGRDPVTGRDAIREFYKEYYSGSWKLLDEQFTNTSLVLRDDLAIETAEYSGQIDQAEKGRIRFKGKNLVIWKRQQDGSWKLFRDMWSASTPP
jgi:uncharacterized protein (TIGR02246 family)